mmetsp:Transcript_11447/g.44310  ORF Transcript_11447/g.44310 Transcript_11447/m.44310 type:complete len:235 (+) Transcript_11447:1239-1943(+)
MRTGLECSGPGRPGPERAPRWRRQGSPVSQPAPSSRGPVAARVPRRPGGDWIAAARAPAAGPTTAMWTASRRRNLARVRSRQLVQCARLDPGSGGRPLPALGGDREAPRPLRGRRRAARPRPRTRRPAAVGLTTATTTRAISRLTTSDCRSLRSCGRRAWPEGCAFTLATKRGRHTRSAGHANGRKGQQTKSKERVIGEPEVEWDGGAGLPAPHSRLPTAAPRCCQPSKLGTSS